MNLESVVQGKGGSQSLGVLVFSIISQCSLDLRPLIGVQKARYNRRTQDFIHPLSPFFTCFKPAYLPSEAFRNAHSMKWNRGLQMAMTRGWPKLRDSATLVWVFLHFLAFFTACRWLTTLVRKSESFGMPGQPSKAVPQACTAD